MQWHQLDTFTRSYLECALWSSMDESDPNTGGEPLDHNYDLSDFAPESIQQAVQDCLQFQQENESDIAQYPETNGYSGDEMAGHDFWLTRNHHGCGFWDRDYLPNEVGQRLTEASQKYGEAYVYIGDDNQLYLQRG